MQKFLNLMFLLLLMCSIGTTQAQSLNFSCNFESDSDTTGWVFGNAANTNRWYVGSAANTDGTKSMYISSHPTGATHTFNNVVAVFNTASKQFTFSAGQYNLSYDWLANGDKDFNGDYLRVALVPSSVELPTVVPSDFFNTLPTGWMALDEGAALRGTTTWGSKSIAFEITNPGDYRLVFIWNNDGDYYGDNPPAAIDNIVLSQVTCPSPDAITFSGLEPNTVTIDWTETGSATEWSIEYGVSGFNHGDGTTVSVNTHPYTISGLTANTDYDIYVSSLCSAEDVSAATKLTIHTACGELSLPYTDGFESFAGNEIPQCWTDKEVEGATVSVKDASWNSHTGNKLLAFKNNAVIISPKFATPINELGINMAIRSSYSGAGALEIGFVSNIDLWDYQAIETINPSSSQYQTIEVACDNLDNANSGYIVFTQKDATSTWSELFIDDIKFFQLGNCRSAYDFQMSNITDVATTLSWECLTDGADFQLKYNNEIVTVEGETSYTLTNLTPTTLYNVSIRTVCGEGDSTYWIDMLNFTTEPTCAQVLDARVASVTSTSAVVDWRYANNGNAHTGVVFKYKPTSASAWTSLDIEGNGYILTGLTPETEYEVNILTVCGPDTSLTRSITFTTESESCGIVEDPDGGATENVPLYSAQNYSFSQSIYLADEVGGIDTIKAVKYNTNYNISGTRKIKIYMANTDKNSFTGRGDFIPMNTLTQVYSGEATFNGAGWDSEITFNTNFVTDGRNIVVCIVDTTLDNTGYSGIYFNSHRGSSVWNSNDFHPIDPAAGTLISSYVPNIHFVGHCLPVTCKAPSVALVAANETSVTFSWMAGLDETSWVVDYRFTGETEWTSISANTTDTFAVIDGMATGERCEIRVGTVCAEGDTLFTIATGHATCGELFATPYFEDFSSNEVNTCWVAGKLDPASYEEPSVFSGKLYLPASSYVILPEFSESVNTLQARFRLDNTEEDAPLYVGVCAERNNISAMQIIDTVYMDPVNPQADIVVNFADYSYAHGYIVFKSAHKANNIDNLNIEMSADCPMPSRLHAVNVGGTFLSIAWDEDENVSGWVATIVASGADESTGVAISCDNAMVQFSDLTPNTAYDIYVASQCASSTSASAMISLATIATDPVSLPFASDFTSADANAKWQKQIISGTNQWTIGEATANGAANALYVSNDNGATCNYDIFEASVSIAYIPVSVVDEGVHIISYDWMGLGEADHDIARLALVPAPYNFATAPTTAASYLTTLPEGWIALDNGQMHSQSSWKHVSTQLDNLTEGTYFLTAVWVNDANSGQQPPLAIDNVEMMYVSCFAPTGVDVKNITATTATLVWDRDASALNGWEVTINNGDPIAVRDTFYIFNNLTFGTAYDATVRTICSESDRSSAINVSFFTACDEIATLPYFINFNTNTEGAAPQCWTASTSTYPQVNNGTLHFSCYDGFEGTLNENMITLPKVANDIDWNQTEMSFSAKSGLASGYSNLYVGISNVAGGDNSFVPVDTLVLSNQWQDYLVCIDNYTGTGDYFTFKFKREANEVAEDIYIDNVMLSTASPCMRPISASIDSYTHNTATIVWEDTNAVASFKVAVSTENDITTATNVVENIIASPYTITGLEGSTTYYAWVAANCADLDTVSGWVYAGQFTTNPSCAVVSDLRVYDIDATRATIAWNAPILGYPATDYIVSYKKNDSPAVVDTVQVPYIFLSDLTTGATYTVTVTTKCNEFVSAENSRTFTTVSLGDCNKIGNGTEETSDAPIISNYNNSLTQMIFKASEFEGMTNTINGITFTRNSYYASDSRNIVVYMGTTTENNCNNGWVDTNTLTEVYRGTWNLTNGACAIQFTNAFDYNDRTKNLVVMIDNNNTSYTGSAAFIGTTTTECMTIYARSDNSDVTTAAEFFNSTVRPNVIFDAECEALSCLPPSVAISALSDNEITLAWRAGGEETAWKVEYRQADATDWTLVSASTATQSATISGLIPGSQYEARVGSICGSEFAYRTIDFTTDCGAMPTPFVQDFESLDLGTFQQNCWYAESNHSYTAPKVVEKTNNTQMLELSDQGRIILPLVSGNLNSLQIRLRYLATDASQYAVVGYITDPTDFETFQPIDTIYDANFATGTFHTVLFSGVESSVQGHIAIALTQNGVRAHIDDIIVEPIRSCVEPTNIQVANIQTTSADLTWNGTATNYIVKYGQAGYAMRGEEATIINASGNSISLTGLLAGTYYDVTVSSVCGAGDTSYESNTVRFSTQCGNITSVPYVMNFDLPYLPPIAETNMIPNCWTVAFMDNPNSFPNMHPQIVIEQRGQSFAFNDGHALRLQDKSIVALPAIDAAIDMTDLCVHFYDKVEASTSRILVGVLDHLNEGCESTFQVIDTIAPRSASAIEPYTVYLNGYTGTGRYIAFRNIDVNPDMPSSTHYLDNIVVDNIPSCPAVVNLQALTVTSTSIIIDWEDVLAPANSYEVVYGTPGTALAAGTTLIANTHPFVINNLELMTNYEIWVRPICSEGDTGDFCASPLVVQTSICDFPVEYTTAPNGATAVSSEYPLAAYYGQSFSQTIIDANYLAGMSNITMIKLKESKSSEGCMNDVRIWIEHTNKAQFSNTSDWTNTDSMHLVYTGDLNYTNGFVSIPLDTIFNYDGTSNLNIAILRQGGSYGFDHNFDIVSDTEARTLYLNVDFADIDPTNPSNEGAVTANAHAAFEFISCNAGCVAPALGLVTDLTYETATINWNGTSINYEVAIRPQSEVTMSEPIAVNGTSYTFTNLTPNTDYVYAVRQVCAEDLISDWVEGTFTTEYLECNVPIDLNVVSTTAESVTLSWTAAEGQNKWSVHIYNDNTDIIDTVEVNPTTIQGLTRGTAYHVAVNAICATNYASEWSTPIEFTTADCLPVTEVAVSDITENSAVLTWTAGDNQSAWQINYGVEGFAQDEGQIVDANATTYTFENLTAQTTYDVYVRALCGEDFYSLWSDKVQFTTLKSQQGIDGVESNFQFTIYPNPTHGATTISLQGVEGKVTISVVDMNGRTITTESIECGVDCEKCIDVAGLAQGTYFVRVLGDNVNSVRKLIVR